MYQVKQTTDGQFVGRSFTLNDNGDVVGLSDHTIAITQRLTLPDGRERFANSNYIIDAEQVEV